MACCLIFGNMSLVTQTLREQVKTILYLNYKAEILPSLRLKKTANVKLSCRLWTCVYVEMESVRGSVWKEVGYRHHHF